MKSEIIIAARGEIMVNLERTVAGALLQSPVCVVYDGAETKERLRNRKHLRQVTPWEAPRGCGQARHYGIETSKADAVILMDGHMRIADMLVESVLDALGENQRQVTCACMESLSPDWTAIGDAVQRGAKLVTESVEPYGQHWALSAKWTRAGETATAIMGACYGMTKAWYAEMGAPLRILEAWGQDEELLSLCSYVMGDGIRMLDAVCGHVYAAPHRARVDDANMNDRRWSNRLAVVEVLPCTDQEREVLRAWHRRTRRITQDLSWCFQPERQRQIESLRAHLAGGKRTWSDLIAAGIVTRLSAPEQAELLGDTRSAKADVTRAIYMPPPPPPKDTTQIVIRKSETCSRCGAVDSFRQVSGLRGRAMMEIAPARCARCGHKAQIRRVLN